MSELGELALHRPNEMGEALRAARGDTSIEATAKALDVNKNTLGDYERGVRLPELDFLVRFADVTGASLGHLLSLRLGSTVPRDEAILEALIFMAKSNPDLWRRATAAAFDRLGPTARSPDAPSYLDDAFSEFSMVKRKGLLGSAGGGAENVVMEPKGALAFRRDWLIAKRVTNPDVLIVADIEGDSMEPTLFDGDTVVFREQLEVTADDIYLFMLDGRLFVKRLSYRPGGVIEIISDNRNRYPAFELGEKEAELQRFEVKGRFLWRGGDRLQ
jgi:phage repressor protein C with HTH and peptisase S24 domain